VQVHVHPRRRVDLPACVDALAKVHRGDGYPIRWPVDPVAWLDPPHAIGAWVAGSEGAIAGHIVLTAGVDDQVLARATGRPTGQLARVCRLFVTAEARDTGLARALLATAAAFAARAQLGLVLDVVDDSADAIAVYEHLGWRLVDRRYADWTSDAGGHPLLRRYFLP